VCVAWGEVGASACDGSSRVCLLAPSAASASVSPLEACFQVWALCFHFLTYDWYCELAASLALHPHSLLPRFGSEVEPDVLIFGLSDPRS